MNRLLVVDDEAYICKGLTDFFTSKNYEVFTASDGGKALALVREVKPQVVLLDLIMEGMNGLEVLKEIKKIDPGIGVVIISGVDNEDLARDTLKLGAFDYVVKPFSLKDLESIVSAITPLPTIFKEDPGHGPE